MIAFLVITSGILPSTNLFVLSCFLTILSADQRNNRELFLYFVTHGGYTYEKEKGVEEETIEETSEKSAELEDNTKARIREGGYSLLGQKVFVGNW